MGPMNVTCAHRIAMGDTHYIHILKKTKDLGGESLVA